MVTEEIILDYPAAAALVIKHASALAVPARREVLSIEAALGRVLAVAIKADRNQPPFDRSTRDGYAVRAADLPGTLRVIGSLRAGQPPFEKTIGPGEALEIMTGAPMPRGANAVLMVEHAEATGNTIHAHAGRSLEFGDNIVASGSEAKAGATIIPIRTRLTPMHIGAAVASGAATVEVYAQPRVSILATGNELVEVGEPLLPYHIRNSNSYSLTAQVARAGAVPIRLPIARDNKVDLRAAIDEGMQSDLVLLSGGVSAGKFDFVEPVLLGLHVEFLFTGVRIQPGKPLVFGNLPAQSKYFFGLPGNPVSTMVTFALFAAPLIRALGGEAEAKPIFARAHLTADFKHQGGVTRFLPAHLEAAWDHSEVTLIPWQGSGDLAATARANCFVVIPPDRQHLAAGDDVAILFTV